MHLTVEAEIENIETLTDFVNDRLKLMGCSKKAMRQIDVALDELFSNICNYAYGSDTGRVTVHVNELPEQNSVQITLEDTGIPFDPLSHADPDVTAKLENRGIGGLGILMVKRTMNKVHYEYCNGVNTLTVVKTL
jgi:anti-sigma regulatory factor (Ser/Thr protein kinase)